MSNEFKSWEEMSVLEQYACQYWDMYKAAYGVRPVSYTHLTLPTILRV